MIGLTRTLRNFTESDQDIVNNYPALKHFWKCNEIGNVGFSDSVGNMHNTQPFDVFGSADGTKFTGVGHQNGSSDGGVTLSEPGASPVVFIMKGNLGGSYFVMGGGSTNDGGYTFNGLSGQVLFWDGSTAAGISVTGLSSFFSAKEAMCIAVYEPGASLTVYSIDDTNPFTQRGQNTVSVPASIENMGTVCLLGLDIFAANSVYGCMILYPTAVPDDLEEACTWMYHQWTQGNKAVYPGWEGLV